MSDQDIAHVIMDAINGHGNILLGSDLNPVAARVLAALRERYAVVPKRHMELIRELCAGWTVPDDVFLHLDGQDLGYADAAAQILSVLDGYQDDNQ